eukprot:scaffold14697_cov124-Cylindrotheca_fusiformis.AAC.3
MAPSTGGLCRSRWNSSLVARTRPAHSWEEIAQFSTRLDQVFLYSWNPFLSTFGATLAVWLTSPIDRQPPAMEMQHGWKTSQISGRS